MSTDPHPTTHLPSRVPLMLFAMFNLFIAIVVLVLSIANGKFFLLIAIGASIISLNMIISRPAWHWQRWQWFLSLLFLLAGLGFSLFFVESATGGGMYLWITNYGVPFGWLQQSILFDNYVSYAIVQQTIAQHPERVYTGIVWHYLILNIIFYSHVSIVLTTLCGIILHFFRKKNNIQLISESNV